jgi:hypothetical protein
MNAKGKINPSDRRFVFLAGVVIGFFSFIMLGMVFSEFGIKLKSNSSCESLEKVLGRCQRETLLYMNLISSLRSGELDTAVDALEINLDQNIVQLEAIGKRGNHEFRVGVDDFLGMVATFRQKYPQPVSDRLGDSKEYETARRRAREILSSLR